MNGIQYQSRERRRKMADKFRDQIVEKNDAGIRAHAGGLQHRTPSPNSNEAINQAIYVGDCTRFAQALINKQVP
jgi:hypothetical protein